MILRLEREKVSLKRIRLKGLVAVNSTAFNKSSGSLKGHEDLIRIPRKELT